MSPEIGRSKSGNECSWCLAQYNVAPTTGASSGICQRHYDELKAQIVKRREREAMDGAGMMLTMVCVPCAVFFKVEKNGVVIEEGFGDGRARPYKLWFADRYECPSCHTKVVSGFGQGPIAEHYQPDYAYLREHFTKLKDVLFVDDCPGGAIHRPTQPEATT